MLIPIPPDVHYVYSHFDCWFAAYIVYHDFFIPDI